MKSGIELHKPDPQSVINHFDDRDFLIRSLGKLIGHTDKDIYFNVYDGKVWSSGLTNSFVEIGDYFEFCDTLREGGVDGFKPLNNFHLKNGE